MNLTLRGARLRWFVLLAYALVLVVGMLRHELWRDETQAWSVAKASGTLTQLLAAEIRYEGHPPAWYLLLWPVTKITNDPRAMQAVQLAIAVAAGALLLAFAPFPLWARVLLLFGYFPLYEWGVLSRNYALGLGALFGVLALWPRRWERPVAIGALLALMANSNAYSLLIAFALGVVLAFELGRECRRPAATRSDLRGPALGLAIAVLGAVIAVAYLVPPDDRWSGQTVEYGLRELAGACAAVWQGWVPLPLPGSPHPWNTNLLEFQPVSLSLALRGALGLALVAAGLVSLRGRPIALAFFAIATGLLLELTWGRWHGFLRHHGHFFWVYIAAQWLAAHHAAPRPEAVGLQPDAASRWSWRAGGRLGPALLGSAALLHVVAGVWLYAIDIARPFSDARAASAWLKAEGLDRLPIVASRDYLASPIAAYLDQPLYYPELGTWGTSWLARTRPQPYDPGFALQAARQLASERGTAVVLVLTAPLAADSLRAGEVARGRFDRSYLGYDSGFSVLEPEHYDIYEIEPLR